MLMMFIGKLFTCLFVFLMLFFVAPDMLLPSDLEVSYINFDQL